LPHFDERRRVSCDDLPWGHILDNDGASTDHGAFANLYSGANERVRADPCLVANLDGQAEQRQCRIVIVMRSGTDVSAVGDRRGITDDDRAQVIDQHPLTDAGVGAQRQVPRKVDVRTWINVRV